MNESFFEKIGISPFQLRVFLGSCLCMFVMVSLQYLGVHIPKIQDFFKSTPQQVDVFETQIKTLLEKKTTFRLKEQTPLIAQAEASEGRDYDKAAAYAVVDLSSGEVIASKNLHKKLPIASLTKMMTAMTALDLANPSDVFSVSQTAAAEIPTKIGIVPGQRFTLEELLYASLLTSANDATEVIREGINEKYGEDVFIKAMNENARSLGLSHTGFANPQGFDDPDNYSTAGDLVVLSEYLLTKYPLVEEIVKKDYYELAESTNHKLHQLYNWNGLIGVYPRTMGIKIGNTGDAGKTTVVVSERENKKLLVVLLGAPGVLERDIWAAQLLDLGYNKTLGLEPVSVTPEQLQEKYDTWQYWK
jgi:D-alanyl-D-alanine carboxypeptidase